MLTIVAKKSTVDLRGFLWKGVYIWDVNWVIYFGEDIQGLLMYRVHIYRILHHFHLESVVWATAGMGPKPQNAKTKIS